jgi:hypothetical protein
MKKEAATLRREVKKGKKGATHVSCSSTCSEVYPQTLDKTMKYRFNIEDKRKQSTLVVNQRKEEHITCIASGT